MATSAIKRPDNIGTGTSGVTLPYTCTADSWGYAMVQPSSSTSVFWYLNVTMPNGNNLRVYLNSASGAIANQYFFAPKGTVISEYSASTSGISTKQVRIGRLH